VDSPCLHFDRRSRSTADDEIAVILDQPAPEYLSVETDAVKLIGFDEVSTGSD